MRTVWALMVMPRSRSISIESRIWLVMSRAATVPVNWISRSARVDLPWSIWATMEKLRILDRSGICGGVSRTHPPIPQAFPAITAPMLHYLYLDYGGLPQYRRELKYSLISLRQELGPEPGARIVVYTDAPSVYANWPVEVVDIAARTQAWSGDGLYHHRIKPAAVLDALNRFETP